MRRAAVFLDRDGTIIHDAEYIRDPAAVRLLPGAAAAIARLNAHGLPVIVVTNQSGIARGLVTEQDYDAVQARLQDLLAAEGAHIDAAYLCPHHPDFSGACECRKPGTQLYRQAAADHDVDLTRSTYVGDRWRDIAPGLEFGGRAILISNQWTPADDLQRAESEAEVDVVGSLDQAVDRMLRDLTARPSSLVPDQ
jgi:histidinol-phosphate phosphatase family protein